MIYTGLSETEINGITEILDGYEHPYEVRISDHIEDENSRQKKDLLAAYHVKVASTDILEIDFDEASLLGKVSAKDNERLLSFRIVLDQESVLSEGELSDQIITAKSRQPSTFQKFVFGSMKVGAILTLLAYLYDFSTKIQEWFQ